MTWGYAAAGQPRPNPGGRSRDRSLVVLAVSSVVLALIQAVLLPLDAAGGLLLALFPAVYLVYVAAGLLAWTRRPSNRLGPLIVLAGLSIYLVGLGNSGVPAFGLVGDIVGTLPLVAAIHLLHAFPSGRLRGRLSVATVIGAYIAVLVLQSAEVAVRLTGGSTSLAELLSTTQSIVGVGVMAVTIGVLVHRLRTAEPLLRRTLIPVYAYGVAAVVLLRSTAGLVDLGILDPEARGFIQLGLLAGIPVAFVLGTLAGGFARTGEIEELGGWLGSRDDTRGSLRDALARALGDPSVQLAYWVPDLATFVDEAGTPVVDGRDPDGSDELERGGRRASILIEREGLRLARISYDAGTVSETWLVEGAANVVALALVGDRLTAELRASRNELLDSRARLVTAAEQERRRIARDLHDGLQVRLVILALDAHRLAKTPELPAAARAAGFQLRRDIDAAAAELRLLVTEVDPPGLIEGGLSSGIDSLVDRLPLHVEQAVDDRADALPVDVQRAAYFVVSEALTNVVKHAEAGSARVRVDVQGRMLRIEVSDDGRGGAPAALSRGDAGAGSGLYGLRDRLDVMSGTLTLDSTSRGTTVVAEIPCAS